jgi:hypothetical protein
MSESLTDYCRTIMRRVSLIFFLFSNMCYKFFPFLNARIWIQIQTTFTLFWPFLLLNPFLTFTNTFFGWYVSCTHVCLFCANSLVFEDGTLVIWSIVGINKIWLWFISNKNWTWILQNDSSLEKKLH